MSYETENEFESYEDEIDEGPGDCDADLLNEKNTTDYCRACGADIFHDTPQCPACGVYITRPEQQTNNRITTFIIVLIILAFALAVFMWPR